MTNLGLKRRLHGAANNGMLALSMLLLTSTGSAQSRWYVDAAATGPQDGLSWATAFDSPNAALAIAQSGDKVWVKTGRYPAGNPVDRTDPRSATFSIPSGVALIGGFDGTEVDLAERAGHYEKTILSGDLGQPGLSDDNAYHVVSCRLSSGFPTGLTELNGFVIEGGNADLPGEAVGGGVFMFNTPLWMSNCTIRNNRATYGAGLHAQPAAMWVSMCKFINNHASKSGGAIWGHAISFKLSHSTFRRNSADKGGAVYFNASLDDIPGALPIVLLHNALFFDNQARRGGAIFVGGSAYSSGKATFTNCTIAYNSATEAGGGAWASTKPLTPGLTHFYNCILWHNEAPAGPTLGGRHEINASDVENGTYYGLGNISLAPRFIDGPNRNLRLSGASPCADRGANDLVPFDFMDMNGNGVVQEPQPYDLDGSGRFKSQQVPASPHPAVDMGAYER